MTEQETSVDISGVLFWTGCRPSSRQGSLTLAFRNLRLKAEAPSCLRFVMPGSYDIDPAICDAAGWVRIVGFGSLLAKSSAERSFPGLRDWKIVRLLSCCRVFGHPAPVFFERGIAIDSRIASLCAEPLRSDELPMLPNAEPVLGISEQFACTSEAAVAAMEQGRFMYVTIFYICPELMSEFRRREPEFTYVTVQPYSTTSTDKDGQPAIMCGRGSDAMLLERLGGATEAGATRWKEMVTDWGQDTIWDHDRESLLPCSPYLRLCVLAAEELGVRDNFVDTTFLANRRTSVREYLAKDPTILSSLPPESVRKYYTP